MKVKFFYKIAKNGELWAPDCEVIDDEKYDVNYSRYLAGAVWEMRYVSDVDYELDEIERVESVEIECFETGTEIFFTSVYKDRVEFESDFYDWPDWSCTFCNSSMFDFAKDNPDMRITIYEGTTGINP